MKEVTESCMMKCNERIDEFCHVFGDGEGQ